MRGNKKPLPLDKIEEIIVKQSYKTKDVCADLFAFCLLRISFVF